MLCCNDQCGPRDKTILHYINIYYCNTIQYALTKYWYTVIRKFLWVALTHKIKHINRTVFINMLHHRQECFAWYTYMYDAWGRTAPKASAYKNMHQRMPRIQLKPTITILWAAYIKAEVWHHYIKEVWWSFGNAPTRYQHS